MSSHSYSRHSPSPGFRATLNIKDEQRQTVESFPLAADGSFTFTSTLPLAAAPALSATSSFFSSASSSRNAVYKKTTTIRAPKSSPIIINLSAAADRLSTTSLGSAFTSSASLSAAELPSPHPMSASVSSPSVLHSSSSSSSSAASSSSSSFASSSLHFSSTAPLRPVESLVRQELAKEVRARVKAQQDRRQEHEVHRQQQESSDHELRRLRAEMAELRLQLEDEKGAHELTRQLLQEATDRYAAMQATLDAGKRETETEHGELLSRWEQSISSWEEERRQWTQQREGLERQQHIADAAVTELQAEQESLQAQIVGLKADRHEAEARWRTAEGHVGAMAEEQRQWQARLEEQRQLHTMTAQELRELRDAHHQLLITHLHQTELDAEQDALTASEEGRSTSSTTSTTNPGTYASEEGRVNLSRPSLVSPLLTPLQQGASHVRSAAAEEKWEEEEQQAAIPRDEQITSIVIEQAAQARQEVQQLADELSASHSSLHHHVRAQSQSHSEATRRLQEELDAFRSQTAQLLATNAAHEKKAELQTERQRALWRQLGQQMNSSAALKLQLQRLEQELKAERSQHEAALLRVQAELGGAEDAVQRGTAVYMDYLSRLAQSQRELAEARAQLSSQQQAEQRSEQRISSLSADIATSKQREAAVQQELTELRERSEWSRLAASHDAATIADVQSRSTSTIRLWQQEKRVWERELESFKAERNYLHVSLQQEQDGREELCEQLQDTRRAAAELEQGSAALRQQLSTQQQRDRQHTQQLQELRSSLQQRTQRLHEQEAHVAALQQWMQRDKEKRDLQQVDEAQRQKQLRRKLGSMLGAEKAVRREQQREKQELTDVLRHCLRSLRQTEQRQWAAERERDEFDCILRGVVLELQKREREMQATTAVLMQAAQLSRQREQLSATEDAGSALVLRATGAAADSSASPLIAATRQLLETLQTLEADKRQLECDAEEAQEGARAQLRARQELTHVLRQAMAALNAMDAAHRQTAQDNEELQAVVAHQQYSVAQLQSQLSQHASLHAELNRLRSLCDAQEAAIQELSAVKDELKALLHSLLSGSAASARAAEAEAAIVALQQSEGELRDSLLLQLRRAHEELVRVEAERVQQAAVTTHLQQQLEAMAGRLADSEQRLQAAREEEECVQRELAEAAAESGALSGQLARASEAKARLEDERAELQRRVEELQARLQKAELLSVEMSELQRSRESLVETLLHQCQQLKAQQEEDRRRKADEAAAHASQLQQAEDRVATLSDSLSAAETERDSVEAQAREMLKLHELDAAHLQQAMDDLDAMTATSKDRQLQLAEAQDRLQQEQQARAELEAELQEAFSTLSETEQRAEADSADAKSLRRHLGSVIADMRRRVGAGQRSDSELSTVLREVLRALRSAEAEAAGREAQVETLSAELAALQQATALADTEATSAQEKLGEAREALRQGRVRQGEDAQEIARQTEELQKVRQQLEDANAALLSAQQQQEDSQAQLSRAEHETDELQQALTAARREAEDRRARAESLESRAHELQKALHESQQALEDQSRVLSDALKLRQITQTQLEQSEATHRQSGGEQAAEAQRRLDEAQHRIDLLSDSLAAAAAAAEAATSQLQQAQAAEQQRVSALEATLSSRQSEVSTLQSKLQALEDEFERHNEEDHAGMEEQSRRWQEDQDSLRREVVDVTEKAAAETQTLQQACTQAEVQCEQLRQVVQDLTTEKEQAEQQLRALQQEKQREEADSAAKQETAQEEQQRQQQLVSLTLQYQETVVKLERSERQRAQAAKEALGERVDALQAELRIVHTHNGGSNNVALNAVIECQAATIESQLPHSASPRSSGSNSSSHASTPHGKGGKDAGKDATKAGKADPMLKVLAASHKKEVLLLEKQLASAVAERKALALKLRELEKKTESLSTLKSRAEYRSKDITEQGRGWEQRVSTLELQLQEAGKERQRLCAGVQELTLQLSHAHVDRERLLAAEKEREERAAIRERQWSEERSRLEQRLAALHGKASLRRKKSSGSSVSFRDDSALHVGDLRTEIVALQEENSRLASTLELLSSQGIAEEQDGQDEQDELPQDEQGGDQHEHGEQQPEVQGGENAVNAAVPQHREDAEQGGQEASEQEQAAATAAASQD